MDGTDYLLTCAEVAVALAGFSALIIALTNRGGSNTDPVSRALVSTLIERSLVAVFLSLFPILLSGLDIAPTYLWSVCSITLAVYIASLAWRSSAQRKKSPETREYLSAPAFSALLIVGLLVLLLQILHALGLGISKSVWWYLVGLTWILMSASYMFYIAVRRWAHTS